MAKRSGRRGPRRPVDLTRYRDIVPEWTSFLEAASRPEPSVFRVRTGRMDQAEVVARLERQGFTLRSLAGMPAFYEAQDGPYPVSMTIEHWLGLLYVQQASTGVAAPALAAAPGERVLDLCAAPGGKTTHLAEAMRGRGCLVAAEIDERRIRGLLGNVYRLGHSNVLVVACDGRAFPDGVLFDRVLVDAPCSGEGTLRRRAGEAPNQSESFLRYVTAAQRALLDRAVRLTRPGGTVLYVTCTFAPEENEAVVSEVLRRAPVDLVPLDLPVPHAPGLTAFESSSYDERLAGAARIYPHHLDSGGLFMAKLRRLGGEVPDVGWTGVPSAFPDGSASEEEASRRVQGALEEVIQRYGVDPGASRHWGWVERGGRAWLQTAGEWPLSAWPEGPWRAVSMGLRALEFDSRGRPRPTNDFLRLAGGAVGRGVVDVTESQLDLLLGGGSTPVERDLRGPVALRMNGDVIGRGALTAGGLRSEIPKARATDLARSLAAEKRAE